jgi:hypothetical protein
MHKVIWLLILACVLVSCTPNRTSDRTTEISFIEVTGDQATRVERITEMLAQQEPLPTPLRDAHFVEEKIGDGELGPADYRAFVALTVAPDQVVAWLALLTPLDQTPDYAEPGQPYEWWIDEKRFASMHFYAPDPLTNRANGWVAIDTVRGQIYVYSFTT